MQDDVIPFQFVGNALALDLVNTRVTRGEATTDLMESNVRLADWLRRVEAPPMEVWADGEVAALYKLRDACSKIATARHQGNQADPRAVECINTQLQNALGPVVLVQRDDGFELSTTEPKKTPQAFLASVAKSLADLVIETDAKRLKTCAHEDCVLMFKDTSKSGRRRWCSMETCGNRTKAAKFRTSHRD